MSYGSALAWSHSGSFTPELKRVRRAFKVMNLRGGDLAEPRQRLARARLALAELSSVDQEMDMAHEEL